MGMTRPAKRKKRRPRRPSQECSGKVVVSFSCSAAGNAPRQKEQSWSWKERDDRRDARAHPTKSGRSANRNGKGGNTLGCIAETQCLHGRRFAMTIYEEEKGKRREDIRILTKSHRSVIEGVVASTPRGIFDEMRADLPIIRKSAMGVRLPKIAAQP
ncbi:hypothetical protein PLICRDRAFT_609917 [Plicaturopsis crispa FD-325 SS-3]|nr:hypothetical protein PLICRDRAFT_609917 [Plicaturopsis crispa FD-325 SS-3]